MSYGYQQPAQPPRRRSWGATCLGMLVALVFLLVLMAAGVLLYLKPRLSQGAGDAFGKQFDTMFEQKLDQQFDTGGEIPPGFSEQIIVSEAEVNSYIAANPQDLAPLDSATVRFVPGEMQATVGAYGFEGVARAGLGVSEGRIVLINPRIEGMLGYFIDGADLAQALEARFNQELGNSGGKLSAVEIQQGQIVATVESR